MSKKPLPAKKRAPKPAVPMPKAERREAALAAALKIAKKIGARRVSMAAVAAAQGITAPLLFHIFGSRDGLCKAIVKVAKLQGVVLPEAAPTVREARAKVTKKLTPLKKPKKAAAMPVKTGVMSAAMKKLQTSKKPKVAPLPTPKAMTVKAKKGEDLRKLSAADLVSRAARKPLTDAQRAAKAARDKARRAAPVVSTPAGKFASLPRPFEASIAAVA